MKSGNVTVVTTKGGSLTVFWSLVSRWGGKGDCSRVGWDPLVSDSLSDKGSELRDSRQWSENETLGRGGYIARGKVCEAYNQGNTLLS